jgi:hypothetical protein
MDPFRFNGNILDTQQYERGNGFIEESYWFANCGFMDTG